MSSRIPDPNERFLNDVLSNRFNWAILEKWNSLELSDGWLVAGCLFQTAWNLQAGRAPDAGIKDYDIFYFDESDLSAAGERRVEQRVNAVFHDLGVPIEVDWTRRFRAQTGNARHRRAVRSGPVRRGLRLRARRDGSLPAPQAA
jgi:hypothetical protein